MVPTAIMIVALILLFVELIRSRGKAIESLSYLAIACVVLALLWGFLGLPR